MKKPEIILIGGGGHCKACIDVVEEEGRFKIAGIIDVQEKLGESIMGYSIIGTDADLNSLSSQYEYFFITVGQIKSSNLRTKLFDKLIDLGVTIPNIISPNSYVSKYVKMGEGTIVMHHSIVNAGSKIGKNCIVNTKALIEHDCTIEDYCHISTGAIVNGNCEIGRSSFIGSSAVISQGITIGESSIVGSGSVVVKNVGNEETWFGNPAKKK